MTKFKRELVPGTYLTAADMLHVLSKYQFTAAAMDSQIVMAVQSPVAWLLNTCCIGTVTTQPSATEDSGSKNGSTHQNSGHVLTVEAVAAVGGTNLASDELWQQFQDHQRASAHQQRKAVKSGKTGRRLTAAAAAGCLQSPEELCLVHLSLQEAVFLNRVLGCCQVLAATAAAQQPSHHASSAAQHITPLAVASEGNGSAPRQQRDSSRSPAAGQHLSPGAAAQQQQQQQQSQQQLQQQQQQQQQQEQEQSQQQQQQEDPPGGPLAAQLLSSTDLWQWCCRHTAGGARVFGPQYAAYHHLRCLGWLPLPGLAYGADYVIYQLHPEHAHSDFVVTVMVEHQPVCTSGSDLPGHHTGGGGSPAHQHARMAETTIPTLPAAAAAAAAAAQAFNGRQNLDSGMHSLEQVHQVPSQPVAPVPAAMQLAWLDACIMQRLARQVLKEMLLLYVVVPSDLCLNQFDCIFSMEFREVIVQRWVPCEHREG